MGFKWASNLIKYFKEMRMLRDAKLQVIQVIYTITVAKQIRIFLSAKIYQIHGKG